nr:guanylate kinase [Prevotella illustrans]
MTKDYQTKDTTASLSQDNAPSLCEGRGRLLIFSAPSGSGKSTIVRWLMANHPELNLAFSVSCTSRAPRGTERDGVDYFFLTPEAFREKIRNDEFLEYEEVYEDRFYGTLKSQVDSQTARGENVLFDVDVKGGLNIKKFYGERALSIFIQPPSVEELRRRLVGRATDAPEVIEQRLAKADYELTFAERFDRVVINDDLTKAERETYEIIVRFLGKETT